jgi:molybdenum cofactor cytidylyltransferase
VPSNDIVAILLAAGRGTRFGGGKLLHPLADGVPIAAHAVRNLRAAGLPVLAVVRPGDDALARLLDAEGCEVVTCPDADLGMGTSLAHGVRARPGARGWVVALADMPSIRPATIARVAAAIENGARIAAPTYRGERGHPVGFAAAYYPALAVLAGDAGARALVREQRDAMELLACDDPGTVYDIDRRDDIAPPV